MPADASTTYQANISNSWVTGTLPTSTPGDGVTIGGKFYPTVKFPDGHEMMACNLDYIWEGLNVPTSDATASTEPQAMYLGYDEQTYGWNGLKYGLLYNWYAAKYLDQNSSTLLPSGWYIATKWFFEDSFIPTVKYSAYVRNRELWSVKSLDNFELDIRPTGYFYSSTNGFQVGDFTDFWTASQNSTSYGYYMNISSSDTPNVNSSDKKNQYSIRLIKYTDTTTTPRTVPSRFTITNYTSPWLVFEFSEAGFIPTSSLYNTYFQYKGKWERVSTSPNRWKLTVGSKRAVGNIDNAWGLRFLFYVNPDTNRGILIPSNLGGGTCKLVDCGNLGNVETCDRMFKNCTGLTEICDFTNKFSSYFTNANEMFAGCTEVADGAKDAYDVFSAMDPLPSHADTFKNCGSNTQTGQADLAMIPLSWGGTLAPPSTSTSFARVESSNPKYKWRYNDTNGPDWSTNPVLYIFTDRSLSQYAGINMRKTTTGNIQNGLTSGERYYMPAFVQFNSGSSGAITWVLTTTGYNGHLDASTSAGDMPGTLSYDNFGPTDQHFGTYDSTKTVYFCFLVTNVTIDNWGGLTDAYGIQGNNYYQTPITIKWFTN